VTSVKPWQGIEQLLDIGGVHLVAENSGRSVSGVSYGDVVPIHSLLLLLHRPYLSNHVVAKSYT
jgi:hypothetical protein